MQVFQCLLGAINRSAHAGNSQEGEEAYNVTIHEGATSSKELHWLLTVGLCADVPVCPLP